MKKKVIEAIILTNISSIVIINCDYTMKNEEIRIFIFPQTSFLSPELFHSYSFISGFVIFTFFFKT